jgi:TnpA family transposase
VVRNVGNNTILQIREHTTDTHGYTEIIFARCHLLGFYFMPRIRDLKDQQLYRLDRDARTGAAAVAGDDYLPSESSLGLGLERGQRD